MKTTDQLKKIKEALLAIMREQRQWLLLVGTGTSIAMDAKLGMPALKDHLLSSIPEDTDGWKPIVEKLKEGIDLETALTRINLTEYLQNEIARFTADFVAQKDATLRDDILTGKKIWVGESLLQHLMRGLSPTWPRLPVITPNYDMLIEYSCSKMDIPYITGYYGSIMRRQDWLKARERYYRLNQVAIGGKRQNTITHIPCIELMKVHGSINLFRHNSDGNFIENDIWPTEYPTDYIPMIAPPGDIKNREALKFHDRLFGEALQAIDNATAFLVLGYGFRDEHIQQKILERVRNHNCPLIVLTRDLSEELESLSSMGKNVWVITGIKKDNGYTDPTGTHFDNGKDDLSGDFNGVSLWQSDVFTKQILGG